MSVRLKDIAQDLNVSLITVSKALRGNTDISDATRQRILKRVRELDYRPNMTARSLVTGRSFIMGLIVPDLLNPFLTELAQSLQRALRREKYALFVASSEGDPEIERDEISMMLARGVDALLLATCQAGSKGFSGLLREQTPIVLVDRPLPRLRANFVGSDDRLGGKLATEHLLELGRRRLAYIGSPDVSAAAQRYRGFREALSLGNVSLRQDLVLSSTQLKEGDLEGYAMMRTLLGRKARPDGVFCHNDIVAIGAMRAALSAGLSIPGDIAFVGFDDVRFCRYLPIPLTSVNQRTDEVGEHAARLALALVAKESSQPSKVLLAPKLVVRASSAGAFGETAAAEKAASFRSAPGRRNGRRTALPDKARTALHS